MAKRINGTPKGTDNCCEDKIVEWDETLNSERVRTKTKPEVLHAEANAIAKVARSPESAEDSVLFVTHAPCIDCAKLIYQSGIKQVFYRDNYRSEQGISFLKQAGINIHKVED